MSLSPKDELLAHLPVRHSSFGVAVDDIRSVLITDKLVEDISTCLNSEASGDLVFGLLFLEVLRPRADFCQFAKVRGSEFSDLARKALSNSDYNVRSGAVAAFAVCREDQDDYVEVMRALLADPQSNVLLQILRVAPTFVPAKELKLFLPLEKNQSVGETGGMGGPLRYDVRDYAMEVAEAIADLKFEAPDCFEVKDGNQISWRSWAPFINWVAANQPKRFLFW